MALINCPDCDKQVSSNAPTCPNCGAPIAGTTPSHTDHEVAVTQAAAAMKNESKPKKKPSDFRTAVLIALPIIVVIGVLGKMNDACNSRRSQAYRAAHQHTSTPTPKAQPVVTVELSQLVKECDANQVAFEDKWKGTAVRFSGIVKEIDAGMVGGSIRLRKPGGSSWDSLSASDVPRDELATLSKGNRVTLQCERVLEVMGDPTFADCELLGVR
jgi:hypothetical protein